MKAPVEIAVIDAGGEDEDGDGDGPAVLRDLLARHDYGAGLSAVVVCAAPGGVAADRYRRAFADADAFPALALPVLVLWHPCAVTVADQLARRLGVRAGVVHRCPAPRAEAVVAGRLGADWDADEDAAAPDAECRLALRTTLLLHHADVNPDLYANPQYRDVVWLGGVAE